MFNILGSLLLSIVLTVGFPPLPSPDSITEFGFIGCPPGDYLDVSFYHVQDTPHVDWTVYKDMTGNTIGIVAFLEDEVVKAWAAVDGKVQEFASLSDLQKVAKSPCDLLPKPKT